MTDSNIPLTAENVGSKVARGAAMITGARFLARILGFVNTLVLARLLVPEDFGLVVLGLTVMQLLQNLSDIGVAQAVVKFRRDDRDQVDTLFTLSLIRGVLVVTVILCLAPFVGVFYDDPRVGPIFFSVAGIAFLSALINPRFYEFERDMQFSREAIMTLLIKVLSVIVSVGVAFFFKTYWAIILGYGVGIFVQLIFSYAFKPYRPRLSFKSVHKLIGFSGWLTGVSALVAMNNKTEVLILGRVLGVSDTGIYHAGEQVAAMSTMEIATPIARTVYPGLSNLQDDSLEMRKAYLQGTEALAAIATPAAVGCAFVAEDLVAVLLGQRWIEAVPVLQVFAPVFGLVSIYAATQALAMAAGFTKQIFFRELIFFSIKTPLFILGAVMYGLPGAVATAAINSVIYVALQARLYAKVTGGFAFEPLWISRRSLLSLLAMAGYFWLVKPHLPGGDEWPVVVHLVTDVLFAAAAFIGAHLVLWSVSGRPDGIEKSTLSLVENVILRLKISRLNI